MLGETALGPCRGGKEEVTSEPMVVRVEAGLCEVLRENGVCTLGQGQWEPCLFFFGLKKNVFKLKYSSCTILYKFQVYNRVTHNLQRLCSICNFYKILAISLCCTVHSCSLFYTQ